jgi:hypothetical protein
LLPNISDVSENLHSLSFRIILPSKSCSFEVLLGLKAKEKVMGHDNHHRWPVPGKDGKRNKK